MRRLLRDEGGQATTEYILILSIVVIMLVMVAKKLIQPFFDKAKERLESRIKETLFPSSDEAFHQLRIGRY